MTNDGWGKEWPVIEPTIEQAIDKAEEFIKTLLDPQKIKSFNLIDPWPSEGEKLLIKTPWISPAKEYNNLHPTHDPYTNPNAHIYYQCNCGKILDPSTKSFAALNNEASDKGWKVRWGETSYVPYCVECGKDVE